MIFWFWKLDYQISVTKRNWRLRRILLQTVTVKAWSWKFNSCDCYFMDQKSLQCVLLLEEFFSDLTWHHSSEGRRLLFKFFSIGQFCKAVRHDTHTVHVFLFTRTFTICFPSMIKHLCPQSTKQSCINVKYSALYQLWEAVCITVKIQYYIQNKILSLHSRLLKGWQLWTWSDTF